MDNNIFEKLYQKQGVNSQRKYPNEALLRFISSQSRNGNVLEMGCGSGANLWMIAREGFNAYGIDIAPTGLNYCNDVLRHWGVSATISESDMTKLAFEDAFFDIVFDVVSMQHLDIDGHIKAYEEAYRCLKEKGFFFQYHLGARSVTFLDGGGKHVDQYTIDNASNVNVPLNNVGRTCFLTPAKACELLKASGFSDVNIEIDTRSYNNNTQIIEYLVITAKK